MKIQTQTQKIVELTSEEIETILVDYLQSEGVLEDGDEVTIENVPDVVSIQLLGKPQIRVQSTPKLESLATSAETIESKDDTISVVVQHLDEPSPSSNTLSKLVGTLEELGPNSVLADTIEDLPTPIVTPDLFSAPDEHATQQKAITEDFWEMGKSR